MTLLPLTGLMLGAALSPIASIPSAPWGYDGHRLICEVAWRELTLRAQSRVRDLLRGDPFSERFSGSCIWADEVRRDSAYARYRTAHYLNVPPGAAAVDPAVHCASDYCVIEAIRDLVPALADTSLPRERRREVLKLVAHFVSDLHQPLHVGRPGDQGGNGTQVVFLGEPTNLHVVWDASLLQQTCSTRGTRNGSRNRLRPWTGRGGPTSIRSPGPTSRTRSSSGWRTAGSRPGCWTRPTGSGPGTSSKGAFSRRRTAWG